jgi:hypothetical protein
MDACALSMTDMATMRIARRTCVSSSGEFFSFLVVFNSIMLGVGCVGVTELMSE